METLPHPTNSPRPADVGRVVELSLVRAGFDALVPRLVKVWRETDSNALGPGALERLLRATGTDAANVPARAAETRQRAASALTAAANAGIDVVTIDDPRYPPWLASIVDPPLVLWVRGDVGALTALSIAIVGSRDASPGGVIVARRLARELTEAGLVVVSGLARGIDGAAHHGTLDASGVTVAVLGSGVDTIYPPRHAELATAILERGAIVSELAPGTPPLPQHFPLRNRIISGIARAVLVVEASLKSGSLITARLALEQGRDVLAVPGSVASGRYQGSHGLIKDGARLVETVGDVIEELGWSRPRAASSVSEDKSLPINDLESVMARGEPYSVEDLAERRGLGAAETLAHLTELEVAGKIARYPGGRFVRLD